MDLADTLSTVQIVQSILTSIAIVLGGIWAYFNFIRGRIYKPRLEMDISGKILDKDNVYYLKAMLELNNVGSSNFVFPKGSGDPALRIYSYYPLSNSSDTDILDSVRNGTFRIFEHHHWIEPNETISDQHLIAIPKNGQIAFGIHIRIISTNRKLFSRKGPFQKRRIEWNEIQIIDILSDVERRGQEEARARQE